MWSPHTKLRESHSDVFKPYSGVLELDVPKIEFHAFFLFFFFIRHNSILIKLSFEIRARPYIVWKQGYIAKFFFLKKGVKCQILSTRAVHRSVWAEFVPNLEPTCQIWVAEKLTRRQPPETKLYVKYMFSLPRFDLKNLEPLSFRLYHFESWLLKSKCLFTFLIYTNQ